MGKLDNTKQERFAQGLARGLNRSKAYRAAGYAAHRSNASVYAKKPHIAKRVIEIKEDRQQRLEKGLMMPHVRGELSKYDTASLTLTTLQQELVENLNLARDAGQFPAANKAIELLLRTLGYGQGAIDQKEKEKGNPDANNGPTFNLSLIASQIGELDGELGPKPVRGETIDHGPSEDVEEVVQDGQPGEPVERFAGPSQEGS